MRLHCVEFRLLHILFPGVRFPRNILCVALLSACGGGEDTISNLSSNGEIIGRVEVSEDVPATSGVLTIVGTPFGASLNAQGAFRIQGIPDGAWELEILPRGDLIGFPVRKVPIAANAGEI